MPGAVFEDVGIEAVLPSREVWERGRKVLAGEHEGGCTARLVMRETGCSLSQVERWVERSRERLDTDEAWVWEIAELWDAMGRTQAALIEGALMDKALTGNVKVREHFGADGKATGKTVITEEGGSLQAQTKALAVLDPRRWGPQKAGGGAGSRMFDPEEGRKRLAANHRLKRLMIERGDPGQAAYTADVESGVGVKVPEKPAMPVLEGELVEETGFDDEF